MTTYADVPAYRQNWFARAESWLDAKGKVAWIVATVVAFILFWPVGLALLAYAVFGKGMMRGGRRSSMRMAPMMRGTGNSAFDAYRADTLRRLEDERAAFESFLTRLRDAKDKAEFDQFMQDRTRKADAASSEGSSAA